MSLDDCLVPQPALAPAEMDVRTARQYLSRVYPSGSASLLAASDDHILRLLSTRQWFYGDILKLPESIQQSIIQPSRHVCNDGFFGAGLLQRDVRSRFRDILPCVPGTECVRRQSAHMPQCGSTLAARGRDIWVEVWHLSFDGRHRPRAKPKGWSDFLDAGQSGWWYVHAPGSGIFYHAGRTLAAPSKAAMLAHLLEEWSEARRGWKGGDSGSPRRVADGTRRFSGVGGGGGRWRRNQSSSSGGGGNGGLSGVSDDDQGSASPALSPALDREAVQLIERFANDPGATARIFRRLLEGVPCRNVSWGRWRCVGDYVPSDTWDPLLLTLGRALRYDSLMLTALMWGRTIGSAQRLLALARGQPPPVEPPYPPTADGELTSEIVDLRPPPSHSYAEPIPEPRAREPRAREPPRAKGQAKGQGGGSSPEASGPPRERRVRDGGGGEGGGGGTPSPRARLGRGGSGGSGRARSSCPTTSAAPPLARSLPCSGRARWRGAARRGFRCVTLCTWRTRRGRCAATSTRRADPPCGSRATATSRGVCVTKRNGSKRAPTWRGPKRTRHERGAAFCAAKQMNAGGDRSNTFWLLGPGQASRSSPRRGATCAAAAYGSCLSGAHRSLRPRPHQFQIFFRWAFRSSESQVCSSKLSAFISPLIIRALSPLPDARI